MLISPAGIRSYRKRQGLYLPRSEKTPASKRADMRSSDLVFASGSHPDKKPIVFNFKRHREMSEARKRGIPFGATAKQVAFIDAMQEAGVRVRTSDGRDIKPKG